jgi:hypothetical protein
MPERGASGNHLVPHVLTILVRAFLAGSENQNIVPSGCSGFPEPPEYTTFSLKCQKFFRFANLNGLPDKTNSHRMDEAAYKEANR